MEQREYGLGVLYLLLGAVGLVGGLFYPIGTLSRMGPGFLPVAVSVIILAFAGISFIRGYAKREAMRPALDRGSMRQARSILLLMAALTVFVLGSRALGLFPTLSLMMLVAAFASASFRWSPVALGGMLTLAFAFSFIFVRLLGLPLPLVRMPF